MLKMTLTRIAGVGILLWAAQVHAAETPLLKTPKDMINYSAGVEVVRNYKKQGVELDLELMIKGMKDAYSGEKLLLSEKEIRKSMNSLLAEVRQKQTENRRVAAEDNRTKGTAFLAENKKKEGVVTLASGVQYKIIKSGNGKKPLDTDMVECNYRGTLLDGTEFDASEPGKPATLKVAQLIAGWKEVIKLMPVGSTWQIVIPSQLAYGTRGVGRDIGPNETLLFEAELLAIK